MTASFELLTKLDMVVDLAVLGDDDLAGLIGQRLAAAVEIDDRQAPRTEDGLTVAEHELIVGTTMR